VEPIHYAISSVIQIAEFDGSVGSATGYESSFTVRARNVPVLHEVHIGSGAHAPSDPLGVGGVKRLGREAVHLFPSSA
jgi:hypothetical protein